MSQVFAVKHFMGSGNLQALRLHQNSSAWGLELFHEINHDMITELDFYEARIRKSVIQEITRRDWPRIESLDFRGVDLTETHKRKLLDRFGDRIQL
jgi:hypothetical protein